MRTEKLNFENGYPGRQVVHNRLRYIIVILPSYITRKELGRQGYSVLGAYESNTLLITLKNTKKKIVHRKPEVKVAAAECRSEPTAEQCRSRENVIKFPEETLGRETSGPRKNGYEDDDAVPEKRGPSPPRPSRRWRKITDVFLHI